MPPDKDVKQEIIGVFFGVYEQCCHHFDGFAENNLMQSIRFMWTHQTEDKREETGDRREKRGDIGQKSGDRGHKTGTGHRRQR